jgi:hypothetical protein
MDTSYWKNKNYSIQFEETTKQFFGKYLYRIKLSVPGGRIIYENRDYAEAVESRRHFRQFNPGGYWGKGTSLNDIIDIELLHTIRELKDANPHIKMRIEEPEVQFYTETETELKAMIDQLEAKYLTILLSLSSPASDDTQELLKKGVIIRKKEFGYRYKIVLRDGRCDIATKRQILNYLDSISTDEVKVSVGVNRMLASKYNGFWGVWFYTNDERVTTFLELILPGCVLNIHPVVIA